MDADYTNPHPSRGERDRAWIRELIDKLVDLEADNRSYRDKIKVMSAENTQLRNNVLDDPNLRQAFLEAAHKDHQALVDRHAKSVEQYNSIIDQHLAVNGDLKDEIKRLRYQAVHDVGHLGEQSAEIARLKAEVERLRKAGDYLADHLAHEFGTCPSIEIWNAAKDVQGSPQE